MVKGSTLALALTALITAYGVGVVHRNQSLDRERMHRLVKKEIDEEKRKKECAENGGPCVVKPPAKVENSASVN
jgi:hypothetical protein